MTGVQTCALPIFKPVLVNELDRKLKAIGGPVMPVPKGPMPTRPQRGKVR